MESEKPYQNGVSRVMVYIFLSRLMVVSETVLYSSLHSLGKTHFWSARLTNSELESSGKMCSVLCPSLHEGYGIA